MLYNLIPFIACIACVQSQWFPPQPVGVTKLPPKSPGGSFVSFKETHICETTPGVRSFSGYVHLPDAQGPDSYTANTFFWFFESRKDPKNAPLVVYLAGGPGDGSTSAAINENGPCYVNSDMNSTTLNPYSWNNHVNMLYVDQPNQVGFSYDKLTNGTLDLIQNVITPYDFSSEPPFQPNETVYAGTFASQRPSHTANSTEAGARAMWNFMQAWLKEFPIYHPKDNAISMWGNSYAGYYVTGYVAYIVSESEKLLRGSSNDNNDLPISVETMGWTNGCLDVESQGPSYAEFAIDNTYSVEYVNKTVYEKAEEIYFGKMGCQDLLPDCNGILSKEPIGTLNTNQEINEACLEATKVCFEEYEEGIVDVAKFIQFDIIQPKNSTFPQPYDQGYLAQRWVQEALGVPVNYTQGSSVIADLFFEVTGDPLRQGIEQLNYALSHGVNVAMIYGDRDYQCNWYGGENVSLHATYQEADKFRSAGYAPLHTNSSYQGGFVRQYGGFSFSRVFEAGHQADSYQPETIYKIFNRAMFGKDISTGKVDVKCASSNEDDYQSKGPASVKDIKNARPKPAPFECNVWAIPQSCSYEQQVALFEGKAVVENFVVVEPRS